MLENYCKTVKIEANAMVDMARKQILPAVEKYAASVAEAAASKRAVVPTLTCGYESKLVSKLSLLIDQIAEKTDVLEVAIMNLKDESIKNIIDESCAIRDTVLCAMSELRAVADEAETLTAEEFWPFPTYGDLLFGVRSNIK